MTITASLFIAFTLTTQAPVVQTPPAKTSPAPMPPVQARADLTQPPAHYTLGPQDQLKVTVFDEPDLTNSYRVDGDGFITFPYISRVAASGLTLGELQDRIRSLLSAGFIRNPQVRVEIGDILERLEALENANSTETGKTRERRT